MYELHNVAIFIDYENIYKTLLPERKNLLRMAFFENLREWCAQKGQRIVKIISYCNYDNSDLYESYHQSKLQEYGIETVHTSNRGKNYADVQLTIDVLNLMYLNDNIDEFIIMSNDKDMSPLINTIKANKRKVTLITANDCYDRLLENIPDEIFQIKDIFDGHSTVEPELKKTEASILDIFNTYCLNKVSEATTASNFKHSELEYLLDNYVKRYHIMKYEMANIFGIYVNNGDAFIYHYTYKSKANLALITSKAKTLAIDKGFIEEKDIDASYDCNKFIADIYDRYIKSENKKM